MDAPIRKVKLSLHPDFEDRGYREMNTDADFLIEESDYENMGPGMHRLMDCLNFTRTGDVFEFYSSDYLDYKEKGGKIIHWLPANDGLVSVAIRMPDGQIVDGKAEPAVDQLEEGATIQFERLGFCRLVDKENMEFWFGHK